MPHESGNMQEKWLANARADLAMARIELPEGAMYEQLCFHAQQTASAVVLWVSTLIEGSK